MIVKLIRTDLQIEQEFDLDHAEALMEYQERLGDSTWQVCEPHYYLNGIIRQKDESTTDTSATTKSARAVSPKHNKGQEAE